MEHNGSPSFQHIDASLTEIERALDQMLALAQLSASNLKIDRATLQKTLERLQAKIDKIADQLSDEWPTA